VTGGTYRRVGVSEYRRGRGTSRRIGVTDTPYVLSPMLQTLNESAVLSQRFA
jgi:hypothetical protein